MFLEVVFFEVAFVKILDVFRHAGPHELDPLKRLEVFPKCKDDSNMRCPRYVGVDPYVFVATQEGFEHDEVVDVGASCRAVASDASDLAIVDR